MKEEHGLRPRQLWLLALASMLSPLTRFLPALAVEAAGSAAWLCPLAALPPLLLHRLWLRPLFSQGPGLLKRLWGRLPGRLLAGLLALWLVFSVGCGLRAASERLLSAVFTRGEPWPFSLALVLLAALAARGGLRPLARCAVILLGILLLGLAPLLLAALGELRPAYLLPVTWRALPGILGGAVPLLGLGCQWAWLALLGPELDPEEKPGPVPFALGELAAMALLLLVTVGGLSAPLCRKLPHPFFILIRGLSLFGCLDRLEAVVLALWGMSDFAWLAARLLLGGVLAEEALPALERRRAVPLLAGGAFCVSLLLGPGALGRRLPLERLLLWGDLGATLLLLPLTALLLRLGRRRRGPA